MPLTPPILPMLAKPVGDLPAGEGWIFEPKWDGFRALVFRDGEELFIQSRDAKPLVRYFPDLVEPLKKQLPGRCVLDGEIVIVRPGGLDFDALQLRLHPAASRVDLLSRESPASFVCFDLLSEGGNDLRQNPFEERRAAMEKVLRRAKPPLHLTPVTRDRAVAADWFERFEGAGLDGVIAKPAKGKYVSDKRVMLKVKHARDCDCVVAGFRWHKQGFGSHVGSLLLGLYDASGDLQHVGDCASFKHAKRAELVEFLAPYRVEMDEWHPWKHRGPAARDDTAGQRRPGATSRWSHGKDLAWQPLRPDLVVAVTYDHMQSGRFRHTAQFRRWRRGRTTLIPVGAEIASLRHPSSPMSHVVSRKGDDASKSGLVVSHRAPRAICSLISNKPSRGKAAYVARSTRESVRYHRTSRRGSV